MNILFFLNDEEIEVIHPADHSSYRVGNTRIHMSAGMPVLSVRDRWEEPPADLKDHVVRVEVSSTHVIAGLRRRSGLYHLGEAEAVVQFYVAHGREQDRTMVEVSAPTKEEALALWDRILVGDIAPDDDYEAPQISITTVDPDLFAMLENQAADMAMKLLETAMNRLNERVAPTS